MDEDIAAHEDVVPEKVEPVRSQAAKPQLNFLTLTSGDALRLSGAEITGFRTKRELFTQLSAKGYPVVGL